MASAVPLPYMTEEEYLEFERDSDFKHEYLRGEIYAMAGASENHNFITGNIYAELRSRLRGSGCRTYMNDMRLRVSATGMYTYSDVSVICGKSRFVDNRKDTVDNPIVLVEVLSPSTAKIDKFRKYDDYSRLDTLQAYIIVSQKEPRITMFVREDTTWRVEHYIGLENVLPIKALNLTIPFSEIYELVEFE